MVVLRGVNLDQQSRQKDRPKQSENYQLRTEVEWNQLTSLRFVQDVVVQSLEVNTDLMRELGCVRIQIADLENQPSQDQLNTLVQIQVHK